MTLNTIFVLIILTHAQGFESIKKYGGRVPLAAPYYPPGTRQRQDGYLILIFLMADNQAVAGVGAGGVITTVMAGNSSSQTVSK